MLEKMGEFFDARLDGYEEHQLTCIDSAQEFYPFTASSLPQSFDSNILDLDAAQAWNLHTILKVFRQQESQALILHRVCLINWAKSIPTEH